MDRSPDYLAIALTETALPSALDHLQYTSYATQRRLGVRADVMARHFPGDCAAMEERFFETECDGVCCAYCSEACIAPVRDRCPACLQEVEERERADCQREEREYAAMVTNEGRR